MFGQRLKALQYWYALADGSKRGGVYGGHQGYNNNQRMIVR